MQTQDDLKFVLICLAITLLALIFAALGKILNGEGR